MNTPDSVIFDFDGTLHKTEIITLPAVRTALASLAARTGASIPPITDATIISVIGEPDWVVGDLLLPELRQMGRELSDLIEENEVRFMDRGRGSLYPGAMEVLEGLRKRGLRLGLFTNSSLPYFNSGMRAYGIPDAVDAALCIGQFPDKDKTFLLGEVRKLLGTGRAAVVGDRYHDIAAARFFHDASVGAAYGYGRDETAKADHVISDIRELPGLIDTLLNED